MLCDYCQKEKENLHTAQAVGFNFEENTVPTGTEAVIKDLQPFEFHICDECIKNIGEPKIKERNKRLRNSIIALIIFLLLLYINVLLINKTWLSVLVLILFFVVVFFFLGFKSSNNAYRTFKKFKALKVKAYNSEFYRKLVLSVIWYMPMRIPKAEYFLPIDILGEYSVDKFKLFGLRDRFSKKDYLKIIKANRASRLP